MCLAVPAKIIELDGVDAVVDMNDVRREANVAFIEDPEIGDYILMHAGFGIRKWTEEGVREYEEIIQEKVTS
ncbi:MAG: HypC/HybG/HupF family hydrogenase formation chaperone [Lentisphaeria bacterium]